MEVSAKKGLKKIEMGAVYDMLRDEPRLKMIKFRAQGGSMRPLIKRGDIITVEPADVADLRVGDVVLFQSGDLAVVHRMLYQYTRGGSTWLLTKGDAMPSADEPVPAGRVIGKVVSIERGRRKVQLDGPVMRTLSVVLALVSPTSSYYLPLARRLKVILGRMGLIK